MDLKIYMLFDRNENRFFSPGVGVDDKDFTAFLLHQLNVAYNKISNDEEKPLFLQKVKSCEIVRLGFIDELTGELKTDKQFLLDLKDFEVDEKENKQNEV